MNDSSPILINELSPFVRGAFVLVVLHSPREKCWGALDEITAAGVSLRGVELSAFDDLIQAVKNDEPFVGFAAQFFPMWRVERVTFDEDTSFAPSLVEQFERRTGRKIEEVVNREIVNRK